MRNIAGLDFELLDLVGNEIALFVLAPVPASAAEASVFEILEGKTRPVSRPRTDAAALASQEGANLLTARNRTTGSHHLIEVAVGIRAEALLVVGGKIVRLGEDLEVPLAAAGAQLLQDNAGVGTAVLGVEAAGLELDFLQRLVNQAHRAAASDHIADAGPLDVVADLVATRAADVQRPLVIDHAGLQGYD